MRPKNEAKPPLPVSKMGELAGSLREMARVHEELAKWLESQEIQQLEATNVTSAQTAMKNLWSFLGSVIQSYGEEISRRGLPYAELSAEAEKTMLKATISPPASKKSERERRDPIAENLSNTRGRQDEIPPVDGPDATLARIQSRKKKRES